MYVTEMYHFYGYYNHKGWQVNSNSSCRRGSRRWREIKDRQQPLFVIYDDGFLYQDTDFKLVA